MLTTRLQLVAAGSPLLPVPLPLPLLVLLGGFTLICVNPQARRYWAAIPALVSVWYCDAACAIASKACVPVSAGLSATA